MTERHRCSPQDADRDSESGLMRADDGLKSRSPRGKRLMRRDIIAVTRLNRGATWRRQGQIAMERQSGHAPLSQMRRRRDAQAASRDEDGYSVAPSRTVSSHV